ncbi:MAG: hypothetical protein JRC89_09025 [Deltaproteobacteria bacterium]|nr:hypothetical protein [Deltaproteobacteria bacterium]
MAITVAEDVKQKVANAKKWREANPRIDWFNQEYKTDEGKIYITNELLHSSAYRSLSRVAMLLYQDFLSKRIMKQVSKKRWVCENNGNIVFPFSEALEKGYSSNQFRNGIDELQAKGLLDIAHQGKGGRKPLKGMADVSLYWIDDRWKEYGTDEFRPARNPRKKDTRKYRGWALLMNDPKRKKEIIRKRKEKY